MEMDDSKLVVVQTFESDVAANIALGVLRTNGIPCALNNEIMSGVFAIPTADFDQIRLVVHHRDLKVARQLLNIDGYDHSLD